MKFTEKEIFAWIIFLMFFMFFMFILYELSTLGRFIDENGLKELFRILWEGSDG